MLGVEHVDVDGLALGERADELDHRGLDAGEDAGPAVAVVRPREPGRFVRRPFGGLAVAASARRIGVVSGQSVSRHDSRAAARARSRPDQEGAHHTRSITRIDTPARRGRGYHVAMTMATRKQRRNVGSKLGAWVAAAAVACGLAARRSAAQTIGNGTLLVASPELDGRQLRARRGARATARRRTARSASC